MSSLDKFFEAPVEVLPAEARRWENLSQGHPLFCEFIRRRQGLSWEPAKFQISVPGATPPVIELPVLWELRLDDWLIARGAKAPTPSNEAERFGFRLGWLLEPIEERYGGSYFNSALYAYSSDKFSSKPSVRQKLDAVHAYPDTTDDTQDCMEQIEGVLVKVAHDLAGPLEYPRPVAETILADAVAYYLDDRFSITNRKLLGFG
jgi:hypothetical protein